MKNLKFIVDGQAIGPDPSCDFSGIVAGTKGYLQAEFLFDKEWDGTAKVAEFCRYNNSGPAVPVIVKGNTCMVPEEVLGCRYWSVRVFGKRKDFRIVTNKYTVRQEG